MWTAPDGLTNSQIDCSDHELVVMTMWLNMKKGRRPSTIRIKYDTSRVKEPEVQERFRVEVDGRFAPLVDLTYVQERTEIFMDSMSSAAMEVLGKGWKKKQTSVTNEILGKCEEKRQLKATKFNRMKTPVSGTEQRTA